MSYKNQSSGVAPSTSSLLPYLLYLKPHWKAFGGALFFGVIYGVSSGFGLPFMTDQIFPQNIPDGEQQFRPTQLGDFYLCRLVSLSFFNSWSQQFWKRLFD